jgi:hypothetical protein
VHRSYGAILRPYRRLSSRPAPGDTGSSDLFRGLFAPCHKSRKASEELPSTTLMLIKPALRAQGRSACPPLAAGRSAANLPPAQMGAQSQNPQLYVQASCPRHQRRGSSVRPLQRSLVEVTFSPRTLDALHCLRAEYGGLSHGQGHCRGPPTGPY